MKEEGIVKEKPLLKKGSEESGEYKNKKIIEKFFEWLLGQLQVCSLVTFI
jgi:hypothetical protein